MKRIALLCASLALAQFAHADVYTLESDAIGAKHKVQATPGKQVSGANPINAHTAKPGEKAHGIPLGGVHPNATGSIGLIDASGLKYFINTNITFSTTSSASGAMSEASYTHAVAATTMNGGTTASTLNDAFDGYNTMCVSLNGTIGNCETNNSNFVIYNKNGPATTECDGRQVVLATQNVGAPVLTNGHGQVSGNSQTDGNVTLLQMSRKVYVPTDDTFSRTMNIVTNVSASPVTFTMDIANNLGSDNNTVVTNTSAGGTAVTAADRWVTSFQNYSGTTSSDVRLGHVLQSNAPATPLAGINFVDGDDNPWWSYNITLAPGQTKIILNYVTGQASNAAAATNAQRLSLLPNTALSCMTTNERAQVTNFLAAVPPPSAIPSLSTLALAALALALAVFGGFVGLRRRV